MSTQKPTALGVQLERIPQDLRNIRRWVMWRYTPRKKPDGTKVWAKMPLTTSGSPASSTNPATWTSFEDASNTLLIKDYDGIGLVLGEEVHGLDLDDCRNPQTGELSGFVGEVLERVEGYAEVSPSGTGIKIFTRTNLDASRTKKEVGVEMYVSGRYFTVTGHAINDHSGLPAEVQDLGWFVEKVFGETLSEAAPVLEGDAAEQAFALYKGPLEHWDLQRVADEVMPHLDPDCGYDEWIRVGQALHHQAQADTEWLDLWDQWSQSSDKYTEGLCADKWRSFGKQRSSGRGAVTLASLLKVTKDKRAVAKPSTLHNIHTGFELVPAGELISQPRPTVYLVDGLIEEGSLGALVGATGTYKSFTAIDLGACIAVGIPWHGRKVVQGPVIVLAGEGHGGFSRRLKAWEIHNTVSLKDAPLFFSTVPASLMERDSIERVTDAVNATASEHGTPKLIIVDTLHRNFGQGDENLAGDMAVVLSHLDALRAAYKCAILLIHHVGHNASDRARGSSSFRAALDFEYLATLEGGRIRIESTKTKDAAPPAPMAFTWIEVELPWLDDHQRHMKSVVMHEEALVGPHRATSLKGASRIAFDALKAALAGINADTPLGADFSPGVTAEEWRSAAIAAGISDAPARASRDKAFTRARQALMDDGFVICRDERYVAAQ